MIKVTISLTVAALLTGCVTSNNGVNIHTAALADSATTYHSIDKGIGYEANRTLPSGAKGAAIGSYGLTMAIAYSAKAMGSHKLCSSVVGAMTAAKLGATANNLAVIHDIDNGPLIGIGTGVFTFKRAGNGAREFCRKG